MITQQLLDFINQQIQAGVPPEQIKAGLLGSGWQEADINQAMSAMNIPIGSSGMQQQPAQYSAPPAYYQPTQDYSDEQYSQYNPQAPNANSKKIIVVALIAVGVLVLVSGIAFGAIAISKSRQAKKPPAQASTSPSSSPEASPATEQLAFATKLKSCEKYKAKFTHLLTGEKMDREIVGIIDNKCNYIEQMPGGGKMTCKYTQSQREAAATYYKLTATDSGSASTETKTDPATGKTKTITTVNGKEVESPLTDYMMDGTCVISGYQSSSGASIEPSSESE